MKFVRLFCLLAVLVLLLPVVGLAASESSLHEQFTTADAAALNQRYREKPEEFITELAKEEHTVIDETAQKVFSAQTDTNVYYTELFLLGVSKDWTKAERYVIARLFDNAVKYLTEVCPVGDQISYEAFFKGHVLFDGAYATAYCIRLGRLLRQDPKKFVQELAKQNVDTQEHCTALFNEMTGQEASETLAALQALRKSEHWEPAEDQVIGKLIEDAEKNHISPKTADASIHPIALLAVTLLSLSASIMLMWKGPKQN